MPKARVSHRQAFPMKDKMFCLGLWVEGGNKGMIDTQNLDPLAGRAMGAFIMFVTLGPLFLYMLYAALRGK